MLSSPQFESASDGKTCFVFLFLLLSHLMRTCYLKLNSHTNNVSLDNNKVNLVTVQNAQAFSRLGGRKWEERNGRSYSMYVYADLEMYLQDH